MSVILRNNMYHVNFPYDPMLVQMLKNNIPASGRRWDHNNKLWQVDTQYEVALRALFPNDRVPPASIGKPTPETRAIDLRYLGQVKDRGDGTLTAFGYSDNTWSVIFPQTVLRSWFEGLDDQPPGDTSTYYGVLGVARSATEAEIKTGYKRAVRQWHPDVCREPNANEMFLRIRDAYSILSNQRTKSRYDVGLAMSAGQTPQPQITQTLYRPPLRCGFVLCDGVASLDRFLVSKIYAWEDIKDSFGRVLVSSWILGSDKPLEMWT
jgi:hypothetical protein